ncbi:OLC1v1001560C1 [Oldenlandia corymbosa var. corymbosa]|uniref:OLC1v1001560C1 n=1 Tax=Oldenlandia corymbosa var. corymbosa TaxID=529605 RepID=A0AAV1D824_OLDCO|nr:OLC1v1001560C1 [Oldenlandia corymbosa var. corymbosa]
MEMKKIACAALVAAASMSAVLALEAPAPAPAAHSGADAALPAVGTLVGASLLSFFAYYMH